MNTDQKVVCSNCDKLVTVSDCEWRTGKLHGLSFQVVECPNCSQMILRGRVKALVDSAVGIAEQLKRWQG